MEIKKINAKSVYQDRTILPVTFTGIMTIYLGFSMLLTLVYFNIDIFEVPTVAYMLFVHGLFVFIGISYFRNRSFSWYGMTGLFCYKVYLNIFLVFGLVIYLLFGKDIYSMINIKMPDLKLNWNIIKMFLELILYSVLLRMSFNKEILKDFKLEKQSKAQLIVKVLLLSVVGTVIYFGVWFMLLRFPMT